MPCINKFLSLRFKDAVRGNILTQYFILFRALDLGLALV